MLTNRELSKFLKSKHPNLSFIDNLKVIYRPFVCPFNDFIELAKTKKSVFDIGCGSGQLLIILNEFAKIENFGGVEIDEKLIQNAKSLLGDRDCSFLKSYNGKEMPIFLKEFDLIILNDVLHHIPKKKQRDFLTEIYGKMNTNSLFVLKDIDAASIWVFFNRFHDFIFGSKGGNEVRLNHMKNMVVEIGFKIQKVYKKRTFWYDHYFLILEKTSK